MKRFLAIVRLIDSMEKNEKRLFKLHIQRYNKNWNYSELYDLIGKTRDIYTCRVAFEDQFPQACFDVSLKHLLRELSNFLTVSFIANDDYLSVYYLIGKSNLYFDRQIYDFAFDCLDEAEKIALQYENDSGLQLILRTRQSFMSLMNFEGVAQNELIALQQRSSEVLRRLQSSDRHLVLYHTLQYRLIHLKDSSSEYARPFNDLAISELNLMSTTRHEGFESSKLHQLFQAQYYLAVGSVRTAIRAYKGLLELFDSSPQMIKNPPVYYFSALSGILKSFHIEGEYSEINFFIKRLEVLLTKNYNSKFLLQVRWLLLQYTVLEMIHNRNYQEASNQLEKNYNEILNLKTQINVDIELGILTFRTIIALWNNDFKLAKSILRIYSREGKIYQASHYWRIFRLLHLIVQAEFDNLSYIEREVSNLKRGTKRTERTTAEEFVCSYVQSYPLPSYRHDREKLLKTLQRKFKDRPIGLIDRDMLHTFHFIDWVEKRLNNM